MADDTQIIAAGEARGEVKTQGPRLSPQNSSLEAQKTYSSNVKTEFSSFLIERGIITSEAWKHASDVSRQAGGPPLVVASSLGLASEDQLAVAAADYWDLPIADTDLVDRIEVPPGAGQSLSQIFCRRSKVAPLGLLDGVQAIAIADPSDIQTKTAVEFLFNHTIQFYVAAPDTIDKILDKLWPQEAQSRSDASSPRAASQNPGYGDDAEALRLLANERPVIRYVSKLLDKAIKASASDIHFEPSVVGRTAATLRIRWRIDGVLSEVDHTATSLDPAAIVSRVKVMAGLDVAERRLPQDGRCSVVSGGRQVDCRIATSPSVNGESLVVRILDDEARPLSFKAMALPARVEARLKSLLSQPNGSVIVTGPTGSGKTTTLYTALRSLDDGRKKIVSVEDPVEVATPSINQIQVQPQIGLTFTRVLRSVLRQDPDIVMIGEIRDAETATIAAQAAMTGHLVLSTLHTNSAAAAVGRLLDMGVAPYLVANSINGVVAQRLVRRLCPHCARPSETAVSELNRVPGIDRNGPFDGVKAAVGCAECQGTGYRGRLALFEVFPASAEIKRLIMDGATSQRIEKQAVREGMITLWRSGLERIFEGETDLQEVLRVVGPPPTDATDTYGSK